MKSRPILFSAAMVRALLDGTKTQTRRIVKNTYCQATQFKEMDNNGNAWFVSGFDGYPFKCPYGQPGDRLWVRETHAVFPWSDGKGNDFNKVLYRADSPSRNEFDPTSDKWKPSIFCRREHSRITLEITAIRCERLQDISHRDALAEGVAYDVSKPDGSPVARYKALWESINGKDSWSANPWVWVVEFRRVEP